jgi:hypothetical protein
VTVDATALAAPRRRRIRTVIFALWLTAAITSARLSYLGNFGDIWISCDFKYDFVSAYWLGQGRSLEALDRKTADAVGVRLGTQEGPYFDGPSQTHPPPALALVRPLVPLGYRVATWAWAALSAIALLFTSRVLLAIWRRSPSLPPWRASWPFGLALLLWPPSVFNFGYGQWSALVVAAVAAFWWNLERGAGRGASIWLAVALALRATPALVFGHLALRARRVAIGAALAFAGIAVAALPVAGGLGAWRVFRASGPHAIRVFEGWVDNTVSLRGIFVRLFMDTPYVHAAFNLPALARGLALGASLALVAAAFILDLRRAWITGHRGPDAASFASWCCLIPLLNPLSWPHHALVFLIPIVILARDAAPGPLRTAVAAAFVLLSVPAETLLGLAGGVDLPLPASRAWVLGLHAVAGLILFACACAATAAASRTGSAPASTAR